MTRCRKHLTLLSGGRKPDPKQEARTRLYGERKVKAEPQPPTPPKTAA